MEERKSPGAKACTNQVQNAKWEIPDFSPRIGDNNIMDGCFPNRYRFSNEDLIHKKSNRNGSRVPLMALDTRGLHPEPLPNGSYMITNGLKWI